MTNVAYADFGTQNERKEPHVAELEEGYIRLATVLLEAMAGADLTKRQFKVLLAVIRLTYGWHKPYDRIANSQISEIAKLPIKKVSETRVQLLKLNVLKMVGQQIGPNKNISEWNDFQSELSPKSGDENPPKQGIPQNGGLSPKSGDQESPKMGYSHPPKRGDTKDIIPKIEKIKDKPPVSPTPKTKSKFDPLTQKPDNVSEDVWGDWVEHRREIRHPLTPTTCKRIRSMLENHVNPDAVINLSIERGWQGLFPEKIIEPAKAKPAFDISHLTPEQRREFALYEFLEGR